MTDKTKIIVVSVVSAVLVAGSFVGGWYGSKNWYGNKKPVIKIVKETVTTTKIIKVPMNDAEWEAWKLAPMKITGKMTSADVFYVEASDGYKVGSKSFTLKTTCPDEGKNVMIFSYVGGIDYRADTFKWQHGAAVSYHYMILPMIGCGIQIIATESNIFIAPGIIAKF